MLLTINGQSRTIAQAGTAAELLGELELDPRGVVVEINRTVVRRAMLNETPVAEGDVIEIVHFVGGG
jgi:thiamine biosynthesis protein ThiS